MQCPQCGRESPRESAFCPGCGSRLDGSIASGAAKLSAKSPPVAPSDGTSDEQELWSGSYSAKAMVGTFVGAAILTFLGVFVATLAGPPGWVIFLIAAALVWAGLVLLYLYRRYTVHYRLTTYRFFHEIGLLSRVGNRVEVIDIDDVTVSQGLVERMFGVGTIHISSSDRTHPELVLPGIDDARQVADLVDGARRAERNRRGLHIESI